jgi:hypothetical protein
LPGVFFRADDFNVIKSVVSANIDAVYRWRFSWAVFEPLFEFWCRPTNEVIFFHEYLDFRIARVLAVSVFGSLGDVIPSSHGSASWSIAIIATVDSVYFSVAINANSTTGRNGLVTAFWACCIHVLYRVRTDKFAKDGEILRKRRKT